MSRSVRRTNVWGWVLLAAAGVTAFFASLISYSSEMRSALLDKGISGIDERLTNIQPDAVSWLREQRGGHWGRYGWYLKAGESGELQIKLPANEISVLKLRLWAYNPGTLSAEIRGEREETAIPVASFNGRVMSFHVDGSRMLVLRATNRVSEEQLVLDRFAVVSLPTGRELPVLWPFGLVLLLMAGGSGTWVLRQESPQSRSLWFGCVAIGAAAAAGFIQRWGLLGVVRGLPLDPDAIDYLDNARDFVWFSPIHGLYSGTFGQREPLHVASLNLWFNVWGNSPAAARWYTVSLSTVLIIAIGAFVWRVTEHWAFGGAAAWLMAVHPVWIEEAVRGLRTEALTLLLLTALSVWLWGRGWSGACLLGVLCGLLTLLFTPALTIVLPLAWLAWLLNVWREQRGLSLLKPGHWRLPHLALASLLALVTFAPHLYGQYKTHGDPMWPSQQYARWLANMEFPERIGTPGFPSLQEVAHNGYAGPPVTYSQYLFKLHSPATLVSGQVRGWLESTAYLSMSLTPQLNELVTLFSASGAHAALRHATLWSVMVAILCLGLTAFGWVILWKVPNLWWVSFLTFWGTWYVAYLYGARLIEPFRHTGHVYPLLLLSMLWGGYWLYQRFGLFVKPRTSYAEN